MALRNLEIGELSCRYPIIQGGMGVGVSLSNLAGAVSAQGGIGVISAAQIGYQEPDFRQNPLQANLRALGKHIRVAKEIAKGAPVAVNIMVATNHYPEYVKCCITNQADMIISGAGLPVNLPEIAENAKIKLAPIISSLKAATVLLKMWDRRYNRTADMVVVEGPAAGGHLGFSLEELGQPMDMDKILGDIKQLVQTYEEKYHKKIPVIFAGGVWDKKDIDHYINDVGMDGVQIATRFVATDECDAHIHFKQAYINAKEEDVTIVKSPVGMPGRAIRNPFIRRTESEKEKITHCYGCLGHCDRDKIPYCISQALINSVKGDIDNGLVFCGANAYKVNEIVSVKSLMQELTQTT